MYCDNQSNSSELLIQQRCRDFNILVTLLLKLKLNVAPNVLTTLKKPPPHKNSALAFSRFHKRRKAVTISKRSFFKTFYLCFPCTCVNMVPCPLLKALVNEDTLLPMMFLWLHQLGNICCGQNVCPRQILRALANWETFVSATMCPQHCVLVCFVGVLLLPSG